MTGIDHTGTYTTVPEYMPVCRVCVCVCVLVPVSLCVPVCHGVCHGQAVYIGVTVCVTGTVTGQCVSKSQEGITSPALISATEAGASSRQ